eukprot:2321890-Prymnesium_polylepis.1
MIPPPTTHHSPLATHHHSPPLTTHHHSPLTARPNGARAGAHDAACAARRPRARRRLALREECAAAHGELLARHALGASSSAVDC